MGVEWVQSEGKPFPLGQSWIEEEQAWNFALYSKHAEKVELRFYNDLDFTNPVKVFEFDYLVNKSGTIWHCRLPREELAGAMYYGYRVDGPGPGPDFAWHTFDVEKILLDPYARSIFFPPDFSRQAAIEPGSNEGKAPLAALEEESCEFSWGHDEPVRHTSDLVIYEMHVRGFTRHESSGVEEAKRGTFEGVIEKIPYLLELGITAVELMPVYQFDPDNGDYWGYMPLGFFSPHSTYSSQPHHCQQRDDFRQMVKALHEAGIEVILDVVYNHTAEGNESGPTYNFKGFDNSTYYLLSGDPAAPYRNFSGTGNTLHTANRAVRQLIVDSLYYWVKEMRVDGFRFDLASIFSRGGDGELNLTDPPIFGQISAEPELANIRLVAEPWDAHGAFQLGSRFPGQLWMQWNGHYRDTVRRFVRGDRGMVGELMSRLYGSSDLFPDDLENACRPWQSINYVSSHDGFTLYDMVSYTQKRNWSNGHNNTDGEWDGSSNCGWEGDKDVPSEVVRLRKQQVKNFFCLLLLSNGTPMFRMGDEFLQTQRGNNNPYNQDNDTTWLDWSKRERNEDIFRFVRLMIFFRKTHPSISRSHYWREDIHWYGTQHHLDMSHDSRQLAYCLHGSSQKDDDLYVMINSASEAHEFGIHEGSPGQWRRVIDTSLNSPDDYCEDSSAVIKSRTCTVAGHSVVVLIRE
ncbi:MAG: glycogen debranching enzyme [Planctomyces sp.]|nr:glycogen debranching enzyme [Planctomyces sp.]